MAQSRTAWKSGPVSSLFRDASDFYALPCEPRSRLHPAVQQQQLLTLRSQELARLRELPEASLFGDELLRAEAAVASLDGEEPFCAETPLPPQPSKRSASSGSSVGGAPLGRQPLMRGYSCIALSEGGELLAAAALPHVDVFAFDTLVLYARAFLSGGVLSEEEESPWVEGSAASKDGLSRVVEHLAFCCSDAVLVALCANALCFVFGLAQQQPALLLRLDLRALYAQAVEELGLSPPAFSRRRPKLAPRDSALSSEEEDSSARPPNFRRRAAKRVPPRRRGDLERQVEESAETGSVQREASSPTLRIASFAVLQAKLPTALRRTRRCSISAWRLAQSAAEAAKKLEARREEGRFLPCPSEGQALTADDCEAALKGLLGEGALTLLAAFAPDPRSEAEGWTYSAPLLLKLRVQPSPLLLAFFRAQLRQRVEKKTLKPLFPNALWLLPPSFACLTAQLDALSSKPLLPDDCCVPGEQWSDGGRSGSFAFAAFARRCAFSLQPHLTSFQRPLAELRSLLRKVQSLSARPSSSSSSSSLVAVCSPTGCLRVVHWRLRQKGAANFELGKTQLPAAVAAQELLVSAEGDLLLLRAADRFLVFRLSANAALSVSRKRKLPLEGDAEGGTAETPDPSQAKDEAALPLSLSLQFVHHDRVQREKYVSCCFRVGGGGAGLSSVAAVSADRGSGTRLSFFDATAEHALSAQLLALETTKLQPFKQMRWAPRSVPSPPAEAFFLRQIAAAASGARSRSESGRSCASLVAVERRQGLLVVLQPRRRRVWNLLHPDFERIDKNLEALETPFDFDAKQPSPSLLLRPEKTEVRAFVSSASVETPSSRRRRRKEAALRVGVSAAAARLSRAKRRSRRGGSALRAGLQSSRVGAKRRFDGCVELECVRTPRGDGGEVRGLRVADRGNRRRLPARLSARSAFRRGP